MRRSDKRRSNSLTRLLFAAVGLVAGQLALLLVLSAQAGQMYPTYAAFSVVGWAVIALPIVFSVGPEPLVRLPWPLVAILGAILGLLALCGIVFSIFVLQRRPAEFSLYGMGNTPLLAMVTSTTAFLVYVALLRRR